MEWVNNIHKQMENFSRKNGNYRKQSNEDAGNKRKCDHKSQIPSMCLLVASVSPRKGSVNLKIGYQISAKLKKKKKKQIKRIKGKQKQKIRTEHLRVQGQHKMVYYT